MSDTKEIKEKESQRENVRVVCRVRPISNAEKTKSKECVQLAYNSIQVSTPDTNSGAFFFDRVFGPTSTQKEVFEDTATPLIHDVLAGYNATVFAYGQSGSGKTHTMEGSKTDPSLAGIIPRAANALFEGVLSSDENIEFMLCASFVEIYMEKIRDLLDDVGVNTNMQVREDPVKGIFIEGVTEQYVTSAEDLLDLMVKGSGNRAVAATGLNEGSSRSHSLFTVTISQRDLRNNSTVTGKLVLVDLAGSETNKKTGATGQQLEEAKTINKSLSALGLVINALTDAKSTHVPYRDSKLTRVLQDSLGGNSKTVLIIACSPSSFNAHETISTLRFGTRAKSITNKVVVNKTRSLEELEALLARSEKAIDAMATHISGLTTQLQLAQMQSGQGGGGGGDSSEAMELITKLQSQITDLEAQLNEEKEEAERKEEEVATLKDLLIAKEKILQESDALMQEAQAHIEEKRIQTDKVTREKTELASRLEEIQSKMELEYSKSNFSVKELQVTVDSLKKENTELLKELKEYMGDKKSLINDDAVTETASVSGGNNGNNSKDNASSRNSMEGLDTNFGGDVNKSLRAIAERLMQQKVESDAWRKANTGVATSEAVNALIEERSSAEKYRADEILAWVVSFQRTTEEGEKRFKDLQFQRDQLETDLSIVTKKAQRAQAELEMVQKLTEEEAARFFEDKNKIMLKSLQHRLEQLVAVHRQLLRKFSSLDIENSDLKKKISLRDERIGSLETASRVAATTLRQQTENHINELTALREQIQSFRQEGHLRRESLVATPGHSVARQVLRGGQGGSERAGRTLRGGGQGDTELVQPASPLSKSPSKKKSFFSKLSGGIV